MPLPAPRLTAIVLCGGLSSRMGRPKAWLPFGHETMLQRTVRILGSEVEQIVVVAAEEQDLPPLPTTIAIVRDARPQRGPLEGLAAGLSALEPSDIAYVTSCDVPRLGRPFVRAMFAALAEYDIAVPQDAQHYHPLAAVYRHSTVLPAVRQLLAEQELRPRSLFTRLSTRCIPVEQLRDIDPDLASLDNLNTPDDYQRALQAAGLADC